MQFQWYPGHMTKAKRAMQEDLKLIDVIVELVDARVPLSSKNPDIDQMANGKSRVILLNKYDLADETKTKQWMKYYEEKGYFVTKVNSKNGTGIRAVQEIIRKACQEKIERDRKRGILNRPVRAMIVGIPNVGKSTFINSFAKKSCTRTGNKPGVTKGKQWIRLNQSLELLDTPGILWPKFEDPQVGILLALLGSINDEILDRDELALEMLKLLQSHYPKVLKERYEITDMEMAPVKMLENIAAVRGCLMKGGNWDLSKAARLLLDDFRSGKLGRITLEIPDEKQFSDTI